MFLKLKHAEEHTLPVFFTLCFMGWGSAEEETTYAFFHRVRKQVALVTVPTEPRLVRLAELFVAAESRPLSCEKFCAW